MSDSNDDAVDAYLATLDEVTRRGRRRFCWR